jgi:hypothetical protein
MELLVDVANVMGSKPDGWWRDRAAGAGRVLAALPPLVGREVELPGGGAVPGSTGDRVTIDRVIAVVEGQARRADAPAGVEVVEAPAVGDDEIVAIAERLVSEGRPVLVVTADRGLRVRLPAPARVAGPGWLNELIGR